MIQFNRKELGSQKQFEALIAYLSGDKRDDYPQQTAKGGTKHCVKISQGIKLVFRQFGFFAKIGRFCGLSPKRCRNSAKLRQCHW